MVERVIAPLHKHSPFVGCFPHHASPAIRPRQRRRSLEVGNPRVPGCGPFRARRRRSAGGEKDQKCGAGAESHGHVLSIRPGRCGSRQACSGGQHALPPTVLAAASWRCAASSGHWRVLAKFHPAPRARVPGESVGVVEGRSLRSPRALRGRFLACVRVPGLPSLPNLGPLVRREFPAPSRHALFLSTGRRCCVDPVRQ